MGNVQRRVEQSKRRLWTNRWLAAITLAVAIALGVWAIATLVERLFVVGIPVWMAGGVLAAVALLAGTAVALARPVKPLEAAVAVDRAAGLRERLSSALALSSGDDPFVRATIQDAEKSAANIHVPTHIKYQKPPALGWTIGLAVIAFGLAWLFPTLNLLASEDDEDRQPDVELVQQTQEEKRLVEERLEKQKKKIRELAENNPDLKNVDLGLESLEIPDAPALKPEDIRKEAVKQLNKMSEKLAAQRDEDKQALLENMKRMLANLKSDDGRSDGAKLNEALRKGDMKAARQVLEKINKDIEESDKSNQTAEQKKQAAELQKKIEEVAKQMQQLDNKQQMRKELQNKGGMSKEQAQQMLEQLAKMDPKEAAKQLQEQLQKQGMDKKQAQQMAQKISQQMKAQDKLQELAQSLGQCAQQMKQQQQGGQQSDNQQGSQGGGENSSQAMADAMNQLSQMEMSEQMMNDLESQLAELNSMKDDLTSGNQGGGQDQYNPDAARAGQGGSQIGTQGPQAGLGYGSKIGEERVAHSYKTEKANTRVQDGEIIAQVLVDGPQKKGESTAEVREAVASSVRDLQDAVERGRVPRQYHNVTRKYFEALAGLARENEE